MTQPGDKRVAELMDDLARSKPDFLDQISPDKLVAVILRLAMEQAVLRDRLAAQEALLKNHGILEDGELDSYTPGPDETAQRNAANFDLIQAIIRDLR